MQDKNDYRTGSFTVLELLAFLAVLGLLITWVLHRFLG